MHESAIMEAEPKLVFVVLLRFTAAREKAQHFMDGHKLWLKQGFDAGVFLLAGSLEPGPGGAILAGNTSRDELEKRVSEDPFVIEGIVTAEIIGMEPGRADERLKFLLD